ncbi:MAG TPA: DUF4058 family protein [Gemmataceae bacterium]|nr:DUF4058 family protein [Gemmataceae bacterium]
MPVHDWTRVEAGIFHHFHHEWISEIARALNRGLLSPPYYALAEQIASGREPDVLTLKGPTAGGEPEANPPGTVSLAAAPPKVHFRARVEMDIYASKAKAVVIRHVSGHQVIAVVEIVSPGNKKSRHAIRAFVEKAADMLRSGVHLLIVDLFPPGPRDPQGIQKLIWDEFLDNNFALPPGKPLSVGAFVGGACQETLIEPVAFHAPLPVMPIFLTPDDYVKTPLEATYQSAWEAVPAFWQNVLTASS